MSNVVRLPRSFGSRLGGDRRRVQGFIAVQLHFAGWKAARFAHVAAGAQMDCNAPAATGLGVARRETGRETQRLSR